MRLNVRDFLPTTKKIKEQNKMRKSKYKYELQKGSKHTFCPACKKKTFKPYVNAETGQIVDATIYTVDAKEFHPVRYLKYPENDASMSDWVAPVYVPEYKEPDFIPKEIGLKSSFNHFKENTFFMWLRKMFGQEKSI